ncbi:MAG: hypothetical protein A2X23_01630 [Chloroflexi bacterium GWC2_73_18]|nr:MAG: hypothetical protein A2X23_01630 [Chloroflexi bacterium GWC2_73_18]
MLDRPHLAGAAHPRLDLVGDEQDAVLVADPSQAGEEVVVGDEVAALALDRLHHDGGDLARRHQVPEDLPLDEVEPLARAEGGVVDAGQERPEAGVVPGLRGGQRDGPVGPAVEGAEEADQVRAPGGVAGELDRRLDRLGAGVGQEGARRRVHGGDPIELAADLGVDRQVEVRGGEVEESLGLLLDGAHHLGVAVTGRGDGDPGGEVEEEVAVDVLDHQAVAAHRHDLVGARQARRGVSRVELEVGARLRPGDLRDEVRHRARPGRAVDGLGHVASCRDGVVGHCMESMQRAWTAPV